MRKYLLLLPFICIVVLPLHAQTPCSSTSFGTFNCLQSSQPASASCPHSTGCATTLGSNVTGGNALIACGIYGNSGTGTMTISSSPSNTWADVGFGSIHGPTNGGTEECFIAVSVASGSTTVTIFPQFTASGTTFVAELSGVNVTTPVRGTCTAAPCGSAATGTTWDSGLIAGSLSTDLCLGVGASGLANGPAASGGYTLLGSQTGVGGVEMKACAGSDHATMTSNNDPWVMGGLSLEPSATVAAGGVIGPNGVVGPKGAIQ